MKHDGTVFAGNGDEVKLTFSHNYGDSQVNYSIFKNNGEESVLYADENGIYTVTMSDDFVKLRAQVNAPVVVISEDGTIDKPYLIKDATNWNYFASLVNKGEGSYDEAYYKLTGDITVMTMMGSSDHPFRGHFDGNGKTLTVSYYSGYEYTAPFRYVRDAEFSNLRVAGYIATSKKFAGGLIANAGGTTTITNCRSSVTIDSAVDGDGTHGGFLAHNTGGTLTIMGCAFDGYMIGGKTNNCAGFVGWNETENGSNGSVNITNCLFAPKGTEQTIEKTFARSRQNNSVTITNSHCTAYYNNDQQSRIYSITSSEDVIMTYDAVASVSYSVSGIIFYPTGLKFDGVLYAKKDDQLALTLAHTGTVPTACQFNQFATTAGTLNGSTLTMASANATIYATYTSDGSAWGGSGPGTSVAPYVIDSPERWEEFSNRVNYGLEEYASAYYQLAANITVTKMVGTSAYQFKGHFDGNGKTLTLNYGSEDAPVSENYCAPFRYIDAADIHDLNVEGAIHTNSQFAAGLAGFATGDNRIDNCRVSVVINSQVKGNGTHGGFVANIQGGTNTISNSAFNGSMTGSDTKNCGGFVGWNESEQSASVTLSNCLFKPDALGINASGCANFSRGRYDDTEGITLEGCYYTSVLGNDQGKEAYASAPEYSITPPDERTIAGVSYFLTKTVVSDVEATEVTHSQATISWTAKEACESYQVRYRVKDANAQPTFFNNFDNGQPGGWNMIDADGDGHNWVYESESEEVARSGKGCILSASYYLYDGALKPDNWLVSPQLSLGGTLKVWLKGQDIHDYKEHFAIYLSNDGNVVDGNNRPLSSLIPLVAESETTSEYQEYVADLSAYNNQKGYIAIRHFNCTDQFLIVLDDFSIFASNPWTTVGQGSPTGTALFGLAPNTNYEYQVVYRVGGKDYYSPIYTLTTTDDNTPPTDLSVTGITANKANISWMGNADSYNLRYGKNSGRATVRLSVPEDFWEDGSGYQMLLDADHDTYGSVIPESGPLTVEGSASAETYDHFEYKLPRDADGSLETKNTVGGVDLRVSLITIPAGTYDWCITNPTPGDCVWIASADGSIKGRGDDFVFEAGMEYTFTITESSSGNDRVDLTVRDEAFSDMDNMTEVTSITGPSQALSRLEPSTSYFVYVQSVRGNRESAWSKTSFTTLPEGELYLYDDQDNIPVLADYVGQKMNVTLVGRTLYKDGKWNTLCLPFAVTDGDPVAGDPDFKGGIDRITFTGTPLEGAEVKYFDHASFYSATGTLDIVFYDTYTVHAGEPVLVRWPNAGASGTADLVSPIFTGVTITAQVPHPVTPDGSAAAFVGTYSPVEFIAEDRSVLYLGGDNTLYYPSGEGTATIGSQRAYFQLKNGLTVGNTGNGAVRAFKLSFGDEETGISHTEITEITEKADAWFDLNGRKLNGAGEDSGPARLRKGLYIVNGKKVVIK